jgi:hypothetical protein
MKREGQKQEKSPRWRRVAFALSLSLSLVLTLPGLGATSVSASQPVDNLAAMPNLSLVAAAQGNCGDAGWSLGWLGCSILEGFSSFIDLLMGWVADSLEWDITPKLIEVWSNFLPIANVAFAVVFMIVIYSTATGQGLNNYSVKKILPRLVVCAVAINVSYYLCAALADLSNILGANLEHLFPGGEDYNGGDMIANAFASLGSTVALVILFICSSGAIALAILTILLALTARYAVLFLLVAISPLAMVCALLPQTEKWFKKWLTTFVQLLVVYPIFMLAWHGIRWIQFEHILYDANDLEATVAGFLVSLFLPIAPLFVILPAMKFGGGLMSKMTGGIQQGIQKSPLGNVAKKWDETNQTAFKGGLRKLSGERDASGRSTDNEMMAEAERENAVRDAANKLGVQGAYTRDLADVETSMAQAGASTGPHSYEGGDELDKINNEHDSKIYDAMRKDADNENWNRDNQAFLAGRRRWNSNKLRKAFDATTGVVTGEFSDNRAERVKSKYENEAKARKEAANQKHYNKYRDDQELDPDGVLLEGGAGATAFRAGRGFRNSFLGRGGEVAVQRAESAENQYKNAVAYDKLSGAERGDGRDGFLYRDQEMLNSVNRRGETLQEQLKTDVEHQKAMDTANTESVRLTNNRAQHAKDIQELQTNLADEADLHGVANMGTITLDAQQQANVLAKQAQNVTKQLKEASKKEVETATNRVNVEDGASQAATRILNSSTRKAESSGKTVQAQADEQASNDDVYVEEMRNAENISGTAKNVIHTKQTDSNTHDVGAGTGTGHRVAQSKVVSETADKNYETAVDKAVVEGGHLHAEGQAYRKAADIATQAADVKQQAVFTERVTRGISPITGRQDPTIEGSVGAMKRAERNKNAAENRAKGVGAGILSQDARGFYGAGQKAAADNAAAMETYAKRAEQGLESSYNQLRSTQGARAFQEQRKLNEQDFRKEEVDDTIKGQKEDQRNEEGATHVGRGRERENVSWNERLRRSAEKLGTKEGRGKTITNDSTKKALDGELGGTDYQKRRNQEAAQAAAAQNELAADAENKAKGAATRYVKKAKIRKDEGSLRTKEGATKKKVMDENGVERETDEVDTSAADVQNDIDAAKAVGKTLDEYYADNEAKNNKAEAEAREQQGLRSDETPNMTEYYNKNIADNTANTELIESQEAVETQTAQTERAEAELGTQTKERELTDDIIRNAKAAAKDEQTRQTQVGRKTNVRYAEDMKADTAGRASYTGYGNADMAINEANSIVDKEERDQQDVIIKSAERDVRQKQRLYESIENQMKKSGTVDTVSLIAALRYGANHGEQDATLKYADMATELIDNEAARAEVRAADTEHKIFDATGKIIDERGLYNALLDREIGDTTGRELSRQIQNVGFNEPSVKEALKPWAIQTQMGPNEDGTKGVISRKAHVISGRSLENISNPEDVDKDLFNNHTDIVLGKEHKTKKDPSTNKEATRKITLDDGTTMTVKDLDLPSAGNADEGGGFAVSKEEAANMVNKGIKDYRWAKDFALANDKQRSAALVMLKTEMTAAGWDNGKQIDFFRGIFAKLSPPQMESLGGNFQAFALGKGPLITADIADDSNSNIMIIEDTSSITSDNPLLSTKALIEYRDSDIAKDPTTKEEYMKLLRARGISDVPNSGGGT